jgi:putative ABC transport system permease protein
MIDLLVQLWRRIIFYLRRDRFERELEEEMKFHMEMKAEENLRQGMDQKEASYAAQRQFGNQTLLREVSREMWGFKWLEALWLDLRYGVRVLTKKITYSAIVILTLALGIGANTAIFSVVNAVLLNPLPFAAPDELMALGQNDSQNRTSLSNFSFPNFADLRDQHQAFEHLAAYYNTNFTLTGEREALLLRGTVVTAELFPLLGVSPALGRSFLPEEDRAGGGSEGRPVILSWECWEQQFSSNPNIIGHTISLNSASYTIIGVMPAGFRFPIQAQPSEVWVSTSIDYERKIGPISIMVARGYRGWKVIGRLKSESTPEQAQSEADAIAANLSAQFPDDNEDTGIRLKPLLESVVGNQRPTLLILFGAVGFVLLIACVNVANLLLERTISRQREIKVRLALGASRWRITRQLLTESILLSGLGGVVGTALAVWGTSLIVALSPESLTRIAETRLDARVLAFTALISLATGIGFGLAPALIISRTNLAESLKEGGRGSTSSIHTNRTRSLLVIVEIALALVLLVGASLLIQSLVQLQQVALGFDPHNALTFNVAMPVDQTTGPEQIADFYQNLTNRLKALPGVADASVVFQLPLGGGGARAGIQVESKSLDPDTRTFGVLHSVGPEYFRTMSIPLVKGREFTERDNLKSASVLIINETLARKYFPNEDPLGKRIAVGFSTVPMTEETRMREVVGVVADVRHQNLQDPTLPEIYFAQAQMPMSAMTVVVRTATDPHSVINAARGVVQSLDKNAPIYGIRTIEELLGRSVATPRFNTLLLGLFAAVALILTTVGLYGVISCSVSQSTHEIGIRIALGAQGGDVLKLVVGQGMVLTSVGVVIGLAAAYGLTRLMSNLLYGVGATDPWTFAGVAVLLVAIAFIACYLPARRAMKVDPMVALKYD